ncbi:DUF2971 domain-containing protein [Lacrimispora xylanolytica]|uniref:DUF2971 domain-containing protein n=1 Tax=Lacrimispora xylanolytica TaxID=29375 RepID=A0ABY7ABG5_9FIRM|nr:DUF2971 domain-containing protein [Lacrimispora xylanolytica]WAJ24039.1 DUF2971 domain-containing protein [Lacrimispora xylanolytica]
MSDIELLKEKYIKSVLLEEDPDLDLLKKIKPKSLFVYKSGQDYHLRSLKASREWMCDPGKFNDPFDCCIDIDIKHIFDMGLKHDQHLQEIYEKNSDNENALNNFILKNQEALSRKFESIKHSLYITCFSTSNQSIPMWSYYANKHEGFCVEYDFEEVFAMYGDCLFPVMYKERYDAALSMVKNEENIEDNWLLSFATKSKQWEHENEWRIMKVKKSAPLFDKTEDGGALAMPFPTAVHLGCRIKAEFERDVIKNIPFNKTKISRGSADKTEYKLMFS